MSMKRDYTGIRVILSHQELAEVRVAAAKQGIPMNHLAKGILGRDRLFGHCTGAPTGRTP